jgi:3-phenylpropionate/trans-cinnamate dioxygenase ferredoxin reductase component
MAVRKALSQGAMIPSDAAADSTIALRELIVPQAIGA